MSPPEERAEDDELEAPLARVIELALAVAIVLGALYLVAIKLQPGSGDELVPEATISRLQERLDEGAGLARLLSALLLALVLGGLGLTVALRRPLRDRARALVAGPPRGGGRARIGLGHALLAIGLVLLVEGIVVRAAFPEGRLEVIEGGPGDPVAVPPAGLRIGGQGPDALRVAGLDAVRATLSPFGTLHVPRGAPGAPVVLVEGRPVDGRTVQLGGGERIRVGALVARVHPVSRRGAYVAILLAQLASTAALLGACALVGGRSLLAGIGLVPAGWRRELLAGLAGCLCFLPLYLAVLAGWQWVCQQLGVPPESHELVQELERRGLADPALVVVVLLQAVALAPLREELLFRGFLARGFEHSLGPLGALLASSLVFAAFHQGFQSVAPIFALGALFGGLFLSSPRRSLVGSIAAHAAYNGAVLALVLGVQAL